MSSQATEGVRRLLPEHLATFTESGISAEVAEQSAYSEGDEVKIREILKWKRSAAELGPCIVFPFLQRDGSRNCFARVRPSRPRIVNGKVAKYEQPVGAALRAYLPPGALEAINTPGLTLAIVEGEKKAIAVTAVAGIPCVGLTGIWGWTKKGEKDADGVKLERELIDDLAGIDWKGRCVLIIFDTDPRRNPSVNLAAAELARILESKGAEVIIIELPLGPDGTKMGADDFIVAHGSNAFCQLVDEQLMVLSAPARTAEDFQRDIARERKDSLQHKGIVNVDKSPTGAGKSYAAIAAKQQTGTSLTILATHKNCAEEEKNFINLGMNAASYPKLDAETCQRYDETSKAVKHGLSASGALCQTCIHKTNCEYWVAMNAAASAEHSLATHARAAMSLEEISKGKGFVDIHEDMVGLLRPHLSISASFEEVRKLAQFAKHDCQKSAHKFNDAYHYELMERACNWITEQLETATASNRIALPDSNSAPATVDAALLWSMKQLDIWPAGEAVRIAKGLAAGDISEICIRVDPVFTRGGEQTIKKSVIAFWQSKLPKNATIWLSDATANLAEIQPLCNLPVVDRTPGGRIEQRHPIVQVPVDLKKSTSAGVFVRVLSTVIRRTDAERIGVICDQCHIPIIKGTAKKGPVLPEDLRQRIARAEHFRGGEGRGSNSWLSQCDLMIIAGTPRVPPAAIRTRLLRSGKVDAAARPEKVTEWGPDWWSGRTGAGKRRTIKTLAYRDRDWDQSYRDTVRAEILQCIGRGRVIRESGMPVITITADDLRTPGNPVGYPLANSEIYFLNDSEERILLAMKKIAIDQLSKTEQLTGNVSKEGRETANGNGLTGTSSKEEPTPCNDGATGKVPNIYILETVPVSSPAIARATKIDERNVRRILSGLQKKNLVEKIGQRGGWKFATEGVKYVGGAR